MGSREAPPRHIFPVKVLVANRGEIAVRIMRACREMRLPTVGVYSPSDRLAPHVRYADEAVSLEADHPAESYLRIDKLIDAAHRTGADLVHPGYGFLAENADFARACGDAGLRFVGPEAAVIALMGEKTASREEARRAGLSVVPGTEAPLADELSATEISAVAEAEEVGYPLFVKAVAGGGGKGMRLVRKPGDLFGAVRAARSEAGSAFGNADVYLERCVEAARHVEVQLLADEHGAVMPFVERECSLQRRHQKVIEETPSAAVDHDTRQALAAAAVAVAKRVGYTNAGTVEFLLDAAGQFYFLEMNTRLQVEHPVTEMVTGVDLVRWQLRIATGEPLTLDATTLLAANGHAIECRIYAEDPAAGFVPSPGRITSLRVAAGPGIRDDSGVDVGFEVPMHYDSMVSKLVAWGIDRTQAIDRMARALTEYEVGGVKTTIPFFRWLLRHPDFVAGRIDTRFLDRLLEAQEDVSYSDVSAEAEECAVIATAIRTVLGASAEQASVPAGTGARCAWRQAARLEGLRS